MFKIRDRQITSVEPMVYLPPTTGESYALGEALQLGQTATKCAAAKKPSHICMGAATDRGVPAIPALSTTSFAADYTAKPTAGTKVTLHTDGLQITATAGGAFLVEGVDESAKVAYGRFVEPDAASNAGS